ncbi:uncharacterized protein LOC129590298 [Paramacrobiotus metropolitanus]|uniref:uncharacterized protein LOC129590298 n=1 Tax=Paramacrobiotus metropolitanus TaxID=2943436 RepID=UPI0024465424|nr:uncharacterized protein LOC129590298 [Paramacrobiotus metropolitanus]
MAGFTQIPTTTSPKLRSHFDLWNLTRAKDSITDRVKPVGGTVKSIYTVSGIAIEHVTDLQPNGYYVAVGPYEKFHPLNYEPAGRHDHFLPMSAKHPSVYTKDAAARASVGMKRRRTFILRLKRKSVNQSNTGQHSEIEQPMTIQAETVPENQPHSGSERRLHTSGTGLGEHQRIDLHSVNLPPHSKHSAHEQQQHDNNQFGDPESEILVHMRHENEKPHGVPSVTAEPTARSQHLLAETNSRTNQSHHSLSQPKSETVVTTLEPSRLQLPKGGSHFLSPKPSKHLRTSSQKDLHSSQMSGWSNASNFRNALDGQLADGSHTSINNADLHSFHVTGPSQTSVALGGGHPASLVDLKDPASNQSVISVQPVPSEARNKASKEHSSLSMRQVDKSSTSISPLETSPSQQSQRVEPSESAIEENRLNGYENNVISNTSVASYYSRASAQSKAPSVANVLGRQPHSDHDITSDSNARVHVNDGNVEEQTLDKAVEESHQPVEVAPPMTDEPPPTAAESKGRDAKPRRKSKLGCC